MVTVGAGSASPSDASGGVCADAAGASPVSGVTAGVVMHPATLVDDDSGTLFTISVVGGSAPVMSAPRAIVVAGAPFAITMIVLAAPVAGMAFRRALASVSGSAIVVSVHAIGTVVVCYSGLWSVLPAVSLEAVVGSGPVRASSD